MKTQMRSVAIPTAAAAAAAATAKVTTRTAAAAAATRTLFARAGNVVVLYRPKLIDEKRVQ